ncbi:uncharacterized protein LMH87_008039 [Akanthomyces muscarius]|uniref:Kinesin light chain n=1 Tax=Akanthomyces muscarius TaxID=2231603 RepID=A0A9W8QII3_AKAMU|nr:uncharacterized protein LMH87_008039 [Akanthomyces muscarius]KAJ4159125.1 hypothetical protein LMH87_008039 [Akanthomyces muscarius]
MAGIKHSPPRPVSSGDFEIAVICALTLEADAVLALFDHHWDDDGPHYDKASADPNAYSAGAIGRHNVILVHMPGMGKANGAAVAANCRSSFPNIKLAIIAMSLLVRGIRGQKTLREKMVGYLNTLQTEPELAAVYPGTAHDRLFEAAYRHRRDDQWMPSVSLPLVQPSVLEYFARPWFLVPYPRNETFVGRSTVLEILQQQILKSESQERVSLFGCGGVGKTQIALEYVYWLQTKHKDMSVFWVHASNSQQFRQSYAFIAQACRIPGFDDPQADVLPLVKSWLNRKDRAGWWLMVIDNADDAQLFYPSPKETNDVSGVGRKGGLGRYIPECAHGSILATARTQQAGRRLAKGKGPIFVGTTNDTESEELIRAHLNGTSATRANLLTLSSQLDNLPLALVQAATYIEKASITVQQYLQLLAIEHENMVELLSDQSATVGLDPEAMKAVALTCVIALKQIERRYPLASELLFFMSLLERQGIPLQLLLHYRDRKWERGEQTDMNLGNAIEILKSYSFVEEDNDGNYGLHRLVQLMTLRWLTEKVTHSDTLASMSNLASTYRSQGRWEEAEKLEVQVMETVKTKVGVDHPDTLASMANVASTYRSQGRWEEAERLEVQVMEMVKTKVGVDHSDTLASMANLASTYRSQGRWEEAEKLEVQVMETVKTKVGVDHPDTLASMINLASTYRSQGRWGEAEKLLIQVVEISRSRIGAGHPYTLSGAKADGKRQRCFLYSMSNLALTYNDQGRLKEAEQLETQVVEAWRMKLGVDHPNTLSSMANLALIYKNLGRWEEAEDLFVQVIETSKKKIGGRLEEARSLQSKITKTQEARGAHHLPDTSESQQTILDQDSGYASVSRLTTLSAHSESAFEVVTKPFATEKHDNAVKLSDELQSLASDDDDIGSQVSAETTTEGMSGQALIRKFLCEEPQFRALCEKALTRLSRERFVENMRRLLKSFHKSLLREGQTEAEKATAGLLRSRRGRSRISNQLASYMRLEDEDANQTELDIDLGSKQRVEIWARSVAVDPKQELDNHDMGEESSTTSSENDFPFISEVEVFLRESMSFRRLQKEFMLIFMPRTLRHVLLSIPRKYIWVSQEQDLSLSNRAKAWIEDVTLLKWNWWPFCPRKRLLRHSEARVFWRCTCGSVQWEEVSMEQYEFVKKILDYSNEQPGLQHWCREYCESVKFYRLSLSIPTPSP